MSVIPLSDDVLEIRVQRPLSTSGMLMRAVPRALSRRQGSLNIETPRRLVVLQDGVELSAARIDDFRRVCCFDGQQGGVPLCFPEISFTPLMAQAIVSPEFPLSPLGVIHVRQTAEQHQLIEPGMRCDARCELSAMRETEKGIESDFLMQLTRSGDVYWSGQATLLSRSKRARSGGRRKKSHDAADVDLDGSVEVRVPGNTGREYARVSGDYNPHHLWSWTARPLGYRRPIAHGMWTFARVLGMALADTDADVSVSADVSLKLPLYMPGTVRFAAESLSTGQASSALHVFDGQTGAPYLKGHAALA